MNAPSSTENPFTIVVGVDYSEFGDRALEYAVQAGRSHERVRLHVIHVLDPAPIAPNVAVAIEPDSVRDFEQLREHIESVLTRHRDVSPDTRAPFERLSTHVGVGDAAEAIAQLAEDVVADLVVIGTHGRRGMKRVFLGSVAEGTVRLAPCPVLVVRPRGAARAAPRPLIEPACPQCLETRQRTDGKQFWCDQHNERHGRRHVYHFGASRGAHQSSLLIRV